MSSTGLMAPLPPNVDRSASFLAISWTLMALATIILAARFYIRISIQALGKDDILMLISWILYSVGLSFWTVMMTIGQCGRHVFYLTPAQIRISIKYTFLSQPMLIMAQATGKCSVGFLILRIIGPQGKWRKWFLYVNMIIYMVMSIVVAGISDGQCNPGRALWQEVPGSKCWNPKIVDDASYLQSAFGGFLDFSFAIMPISIFWNLRLSLFKKVVLCLFMGAGVFTGAAAIIKTIELRNLGNSGDITWATYSLALWAGTEQVLIMICGSLPTLRPFYDRAITTKIFTKNFTNASSTRYFRNVDKSGLTNNAGNISEVTARTASQSASSDHELENKMIAVKSTYEIELEYRNTIV